jgi:hypothetical protein
MHGAMCAAAKGESQIGIPKAVGKEFCAADRGKRFPSKNPHRRKLRRTS